MNVTVEEVSSTRKTLRVDIDPADLQAEEKKLLQRYSQQARIPGFRPGKAPPEMVRRKFGKQIRDELRRAVLSRAYETGMKEADLPVLAVIEAKDDNFDLDNGGPFEVTVDVRPEFDLPNYTGIAVKAPKVVVEDKEVDDALDEIRKQQSKFEPVEREAAEGDYVQVTYTGTVDDKPLADLAPDLKIWGTQNKTWEEAGASEAGVPAVADGVIGMKAGDTKETTMTLPDAFPVEDLQGKEAKYQLEVHEVRERILPEMDEDFLKGFNVENVEALRQQISDDIRSRKDQERGNHIRRQISENILNQVNFDLPQSNIETETNNIRNEVIQQNRQRGLPEEEIEKHQADIESNAASMARERVKLYLILGRIAEQEKIEVSNEDMQRAIMMNAMQTRRKPEEIVKELEGNREAVNSMRQNLLISKTMGWLSEKADVEEVVEAS